MNQSHVDFIHWNILFIATIKMCIQGKVFNREIIMLLLLLMLMMFDIQIFIRSVLV